MTNAQTRAARVTFLAAGLCVALVLLFAAAPQARAAELTESQIASILNVLASFGVDQATYNSVSRALRGGQGSSNANATPGSVRVAVNSNDYDTENPKITGTAKGISRLGLSLGDGRYRVYESGLIRVPSNGKWSHVVEDDLDEGVYDVFVFSENGTLLAKGKIEIEDIDGDDDENGDDASLTASPKTGDAPLEVEFAITDLSTRDGSYVITHELNFGDNTDYEIERSGRLELEHTYSRSGTYKAELIKLVYRGCSSGESYCYAQLVRKEVVDSETITVGNNDADVTLKASVSSGRAPLSVSFTVQGESGVDYSRGYSVSFGDGSESSVSVVGQATCYSLYCPYVYGISHSYSQAGTYKAELVNGDDEALDSVTITVTAVPTTPSTPGSPTTVDKKRAPYGWLDSVGCSVAEGWSYDEDTPTAATQVHFYVDGAWGGFATANGERPDLASAVGSTEHGFVWNLPAHYMDGRQHSIRAYGIDTTIANTNNKELYGSPKTFQCSSAYAPAAVSGVASILETSGVLGLMAAVALVPWREAVESLSSTLFALGLY